MLVTVMHKRDRYFSIMFSPFTAREPRREPAVLCPAQAEKNKVALFLLEAEHVNTVWHLVADDLYKLPVKGTFKGRNFCLEKVIGLFDKNPALKEPASRRDQRPNGASMCWNGPVGELVA